MKTKKCYTCKKVKPVSEFYENRVNGDRLHGIYEECIKQYSKQCYVDNAEREKQRNKQYQKDNAEHLKQWRVDNTEHLKQYRKDNAEHISQQKKQYHKDNAEYIGQYRKDNAEHFKQYRKQRYKNNPQIRLSESIKSGIRHSLKGNKNGKHWEDLLGYTLQDLITHLGGLFKPGMEWHNIGEWHIDHIIPISLWKFETYNDREFKQCWALANLQPLWAGENFSKGNKI